MSSQSRDPQQRIVIATPEQPTASAPDSSGTGAVPVSKTYHGKPCKYGHTLRYRSNYSCVECERQRHRDYYARNREREQTRKREYNQQMANDPAWRARKRESTDKSYEKFRDDHLRYYAHMLRNRRRAALKRKEARHGSLPDEG